MKLMVSNLRMPKVIDPVTGQATHDMRGKARTYNRMLILVALSVRVSVSRKSLAAFVRQKAQNPTASFAPIVRPCTNREPISLSLLSRLSRVLRLGQASVEFCPAASGALSSYKQTNKQTTLPWWWQYLKPSSYNEAVA